MLKDSTAVIGLGLGGMTVTYEFQERNYLTYSVNGSEQDIKSMYFNELAKYAELIS